MTTSIHPLARCESEHIGEGTRIWAFAHILAGATIGAECNIGDYVFVEDGVTIGNGVTVKNGVQLYRGVRLEDGVFVGPNAVFTNDLRPRAGVRKPPDELLPTVVRKGATIGANATVVCGIEIGSAAMVAAGAVVTRTVPPHALVAGVPARVQRWVCVCGGDLSDASQCEECGRRYEAGPMGLHAVLGSGSTSAAPKKA